MMQIFMDANGWIALNNKRDQWHVQALKLNKDLLLDGYRYVTTNYVLDEAYTGLLMKAGHWAAVDFGEKIQSARTIKRIHITPDIEEEAWKLFKQYDDKNFSFTDCTSFVVMHEWNLMDAFTNDRHFAQMGFNIHLK